MERLFKRILPTIIAVGAGVLTLVGYLVPAPDLISLLVRWAVIVAAFALILGAVNVLRVHFKRFSRGKRGWPYSITLLLVALVSFGVTAAGLLPALLPELLSGLSVEPISLFDDWVEPIRLFSDSWFNYVILPLEAGAAGLVAFALALAAFRLMRSGRRNPFEAIVFLLSALIVLLGATPLPSPTWLTALRDMWMSVPVLAGMRGLLIGVGLGTLVIGLRVIIGLDKPHSDV